MSQRNHITTVNRYSDDENLPARVSQKYAIAEQRDNYNANLAKRSIENYTIIQNIVNIADNICPQATETNTQIAKTYAYKAMDNMRTWDAGL